MKELPSIHEYPWPTTVAAELLKELESLRQQKKDLLEEIRGMQREGRQMASDLARYESGERW